MGGEVWHCGLMVALVYEKYGQVDNALEWAERISTLDDPVQGGNLSEVSRTRAKCAQGRCLALKHRYAEAKEMLICAAQQYAALGLYLGEVLALRDLYVCVLQKDGEDCSDEGISLLKPAIDRLLGPNPAPDDLEVLAKCLGQEVAASVL